MIDNRSIDERTKELLEIPNQLNNIEFKKATPYFDHNNKELSLKQEKFAYYYVMTDENRMEAGRLAGYSEKGLHTAVSRLLHDVKIQNAIKRVIRNELQLNKLTLEYNIFKKLKLIIDSDILDYVDERGFLKCRFSDIPKQLRQLIKKVENKYYGQGKNKKRVVTFEIMNKEWAMDKLMHYINMIKDNTTNITLVSDDMKVNMMNILQGKELPGGKE